MDDHHLSCRNTALIQCCALLDHLLLASQSRSIEPFLCGVGEHHVCLTINGSHIKDPGLEAGTGQVCRGCFETWLSEVTEAETHVLGVAATWLCHAFPQPPGSRRSLNRINEET